MDIFETIHTRKSVRKFSSEIVPLEDVKKIIDAARVAPSSTNSQMWHFVAILNKEVQQQMKTAIIDTFDEMFEWEVSDELASKIEMYKNYSTFFVNAPVTITVYKTPRESSIDEFMKKSGLDEKELSRRRPYSEFQSIGAAIQNFSLAAHALGYGSCWMTAPIQAYKQLEKIINKPSEWELVSIMALGKPEYPNDQTTPKKSLNEVLSIIE